MHNSDSKMAAEDVATTPLSTTSATTPQTRIERIRNAVLENRRGWIICLCALIITVVRSGMIYSFGSFTFEVGSLSNMAYEQQVWINTVPFSIMFMFAPLMVALIRCMHQKGFRIGGAVGTVILSVSCLSSSFVPHLEWMFLTHSTLYGIGSSLIYMASSLVIGEYFDKNHKYHVFATSILPCGYPIGSLIFNSWLVNSVGWRFAFRVNSGLIFVIGLACCLTFSSKQQQAGPEERNTPALTSEGKDIDMDTINPPPEAPVEVAQESRRMSRRCCTLEEFRSRPEIALWCIGNFLSFLGFYMSYISQPWHLELKGISPSHSSRILTLLSVAQVITCVIASFLGYKLRGRLIFVNIIAATALSLIFFFTPIMDSHGMMMIINKSIVLGGFSGLTIVYMYAASGEVTQLPIDIAWSFTNFSCGLGILIGPFLPGVIYDRRKSYDDVFYVVGALYLLAALVFTAIPIIGKCCKRRSTH